MKKTISLLLALCMLLSVIPVLGMNALAGGGTTLTILSEDFEKMDDTSILRWSFVDVDGRQNGWISTLSGFNIDYASNAMLSFSYIREDQQDSFDGNFGIQNPDNELISPEIEIPEDYNTTLTFEVFAVDTQYAEEKISVYFMDGSKSTEIYSTRLDSSASRANPQTVTVDLSQFAGQSGMLCFRHHDTSDQYIIGLDNVRVMSSEIVYCDLDILVVNGGYANAGTVTGEGTYPEGTEVTVTAKPNRGFGFWSWSGEGDNVLTEELSYTFTIYEDTVLIADFFKAPFEDICGTDYYFDPILWAVDEGITTGTTPTTFSPEDTCTRAQVVTFLHRSVGCPMPMPESPFSDVTGGEYYYDAVLWAAGSKITTGTTPTTFSPHEGCTRGQVVTFLWRTFGKPAPTSNNNPFTDVPASAYYYDAVLWAVEMGITTGTTTTTFSPEATCTRGQIVTFLYRAAHTPVDDSPAPEIVYQYPSYMEYPGELAEFWVVVGGGTEPYTYEWQYICDDTEEYISLTDIGWAYGADTDRLSFYVDTTDYFSHMYYRCKVTDSKGKTVYSEPVCILEPLHITQHPQDVYCNDGDTVEFFVVASGGTKPYTYQWQYTYDDADEDWFSFDDEEWASGYFTDKLLVDITEADFDANYRYRCVVTDALGDVVASLEAYPLEAMG